MKPNELNVILDRIEILARRRDSTPASAAAQPAEVPVTKLSPLLLDFVRKARTIRDQYSDVECSDTFAFGRGIQDNISHGELRVALAILEKMGYV
jgi:hypothetical protein